MVDQVAKKETPVLFRQRKDGAIIAIFPTVYGGNGPDSCVAYTQAEKKIVFDLSDMKTTIQANMLQSLPLLQEVSHAGFFPMKIVQRIKEPMNKERLAGVPAAAIGPKTKEKKAAVVHKKRPNRWLQGVAA